MKSYFTIFIIFAFSFLITSCAIAQLQSHTNSANDLLYVPKTLSRTSKSPLLLVLSPTGDPRWHIQLLKPIAEKCRWILVGDDYFKNGVDMNLCLPHILQTIQNVQSRYPIDSQKIYSCGLSGGAMGSYLLAQMRPDLIHGIIANTGMMPYVSDHPFDGSLPANFPRGKSVAMLASPTDFRYQAMIKNKATLESLGWKIKWIEFQGGHTLAPAECYESAIAWLSQQP